MNDSEPPTPLPPPRRRKLEERVNDLETGMGKVMRELGRIWDSINGVDRTSETSLSVHPNRFRLSFKGVSGWTVFAVFLTICIAVIVWLVTRKL